MNWLDELDTPTAGSEHFWKSVRTGLYVGGVTIYPPNTREVHSARDLREPYDSKRRDLIRWYEALGSRPEYGTQM